MQRSTSLDISGMQKQKSIESFSDRTLKTEKKDRFKHNELVPGVDVARTSSSLYDSGYYSECEVLRPSKSSEIYANSDEKFAIKSIEVDPSSTNQRRESTIGDNTKKSCANLDQISSTSCIFSTFQDIESQLEDKSLNNESNKNTFTLRPMVTDSGFNVSPSHLEYDFESLLHPHGNKLHSGSSASTSTTSTDCSTCTTQTVEDVSSSMENINLIDGEAWDLLSNSIPTVSFQDDTPEFQFSSDDSISSDPDEFSRYISPTTPLFPDVPQDELDCLDPVFLYENTRFVSFEMNKGPKSSRNTTTKHGKEQTSFIRSFYTQTLKEELKSKILLRRFDAGQEELETGSPEPKPTISYDAVKKRHAIREKNKLYAKESRDRAHIKRQELELKHEELLREREELRGSMSRLSRQLYRLNKVLTDHARSCQLDKNLLKTVTEVPCPRHQFSMWPYSYRPGLLTRNLRLASVPEDAPQNQPKTTTRSLLCRPAKGARLCSC